jgi:hypothetical protein
LARQTTDYGVLPLSEDDDWLDDVSDPVVVAVSLVGAPVVVEVLAVLPENNRWIAPAAARIPGPGFPPLDDRVVPTVVDGDTFLPSVAFLETASVAVPSPSSA